MSLPDESVLRLIYLGLLFAALSGWALVELRQNFSKTVKTLLAWVLIFLGVLAAYGLWGDIRRGLLPTQLTESGAVTLPRADDGHYYAQLTINGHSVTFMADTGASDVVLSPADAKRVGIDPQGLAYIGQAMTANGVVRTARVQLDHVEFGPFHDSGLGASVDQSAMDISLLGMDYLGRFQITIAGGQMVLRR